MYKRKAGPTLGTFKRPRQTQAGAAKQRTWRTSASKRRTYGSAAIRPEVKFYDTNLGATAFVAPTDAAGGELDPSATSMISTPPQGTTASERDGKRISCKYLEIKGIVYTVPVNNQATGFAHLEASVYVVLDTQSNIAQMNSEDCFKNLSATAVMAPHPLRNLLFGSRFRVLKQKTFNLDMKTGSYDGTANQIDFSGTHVPFTMFIPLKNLVINFNAGTTASIVNVVDNSIHVIGFANNVNVFIQYNSRLRFVG